MNAILPFASPSRVSALKRSLTRSLSAKYPELSKPLIVRILDDAAAVAEGAGFPVLFLPALADESAGQIRAAVFGLAGEFRQAPSEPLSNAFDRAGRATPAKPARRAA